MKKLLFVYNPHSGKGEIGKALSDVLCVFTQAGFDCTVHPTAESNDGRNFIAEHGNEFDLIVCSGGDGMLHELVCGMTSQNIERPCGYIPTGTVNDFASSLDIPKTPIDAAKMIICENYEDIDVGVFNDTYFGYIAAFGMFTNVSYSTDQKVKNVLGATAYLLEALKSMNLKTFFDSSVHAVISREGGELVEDDFIFGMTGNTHSVAGIKNFVPTNAEMNDGLIDGMFIKTPRTPLELNQIKNALLSQNYNDPYIICASSPEFKVMSTAEIPWTLDGEFGGNFQTARISVRNKSLKIAVPEKKEALNDAEGQS